MVNNSLVIGKIAEAGDLVATDLLYDEVTGDLVINDGHPIEISGVEELAQAVRSLLTTPKGTALNEDELGMDMSFLVGGFDEKMAVEAADRGHYAG